MGGRAAVGWAAGLSVLVVGVLVFGTRVPGALVDLAVYRTGGAAWLHDIPLYTREFPAHLPFTYPPLSAVAFGSLAVVSWPVAVAMISFAGMLALTATVVLAVPARARTALPATAAAAVTVACGLALEPVRETLLLGQINLVLMGLVALDCLLPRTRYPRGMLVGLAAALKLTPLFFLVYFLARRQYTAAATALATFAGVTGFAVLLAPRDSISYWTTTIFHTDRIGGAAFATNQSLRGALHRLDLPPGVVQACWLLLLAAVLALTWLGARRAHLADDRVRALLVVAAGGLLLSPVSWSHHWVWIAPALAVGWTAVYRRWPIDRGGRPAITLLVTTALFTIGQRILPHADQHELHWTWWQHLLGNSYLFAALAFLIWTARHTVPAPPAVTRRELVPQPV
jgi:alpha-1,2-mannosyltransferase